MCLPGNIRLGIPGGHAGPPLQRHYRIVSLFVIGGSSDGLPRLFSFPFCSFFRIIAFVCPFFRILAFCILYVVLFVA